MSKRLRVGTWSVVLLTLLLSTAGCGGGSFIGHRYDNFTAYYNTFYNARRSFQEGVKALEQTAAPVDRRYYISVFTAPGRATNTQTFQNAIDKSADVLREHPNSKWVDDALMLIGQSYFYQENYVGAEQKFREVIDLGSGLEDEARLWLARTLIAAGAYNEARDHLVVSLSLEDLSKRWAPELHLALGQLYVRLEAFADAAEQLRLGLEDVRDNDLEARGWFLLGQVYEQLEQYEEAVAAFERVRHAHPRYELSYAADVSAIRIRGVHLDAEQALRDLRRMERDDKNYANRFELAYLRALIYQAQGRAGQAQQLYHDILYDPDGQIGDLRGRIHYALGQFYEEVRGDFIKAAAHYDTARTNLSGQTSTTQQQLQFAPEAITDVEQRATTFATFASAYQNVARMDSLLELGSLEPEAFAERILEIRREMAAEMARQQRLVERRQAERGFQNAAAMAGEEYTSGENQDTGTAGFLFHRDPIRVQENRLSFIDRWGERPHVPNWRRMEAVFAAQAAHNQSGDAVSDEMADLDAGIGEAPLPQLDYSAVPRDSISRARMHTDRALARYNLGNVLFLSMNMPDSAAAWYRLIITEDANEEVAQRAYYALAEVQRSLGDTAAAQQIYKQVLRDYPNSDFAGRVREQLGIREDVPSDSLALARADYEAAYARWRRGYHYDALNRMIAVAARHRHTEMAPKALLAAARIYLEWANEDSLGIFDPLPINVSDSLIALAGLYDVSYDLPADQTDGTDAGQSWAADSTAPDSTLGALDADGLDAKELIAAEEDAAGDAVDLKPRQRMDPTGEAPPDSVPDGQPPSNDPDSSVAGDTAVPDWAADSLDADARVLADSLATIPTDSLAGVQAESVAAVAGPTANRPVSPASIRVDSLAALAGLSADSLASLVGLPADSLPGDLGMSIDSLATLAGVPADSILTLLRLPAAPATERKHAIQPVQDDAVYLKTLYASVRQNYPSTPYAGQAERMLEVLAVRQPQAEPDLAEPLGQIDSLADVRADSSDAVSANSSVAESADAGVNQTVDSSAVWSADSTAAWSADSTIARTADSTEARTADSTEARTADSSVAVPGDSLEHHVLDSVMTAEPDSALTARPNLAGGARPSDSTSADDSVAAADSVVPADAAAPAGSTDASQQDAAIPTGEAAMKGEGIRQELGGYTLMIGMHLRKAPMDALAARYAEAGFRTAVITEKVGSTELYRAVVGQFATQREAGEAMMQYESEFEEQLQVTSLTNPSSSATGMR